MVVMLVAGVLFMAIAVDVDIAMDLAVGAGCGRHGRLQPIYVLCTCKRSSGGSSGSDRSDNSSGSGGSGGSGSGSSRIPVCVRACMYVLCKYGTTTETSTCACVYTSARIHPYRHERAEMGHHTGERCMYVGSVVDSRY